MGFVALGVFTVVQLFESYFLTSPRIMGQSTGLPPLVHHKRHLLLWAQKPTALGGILGMMDWLHTADSDPSLSCFGRLLRKKYLRRLMENA